MFVALVKRFWSGSITSPQEVKRKLPDPIETEIFELDVWLEPQIDHRGVFNSFDSPHDMSGREISKKLRKHLSYSNREVTRIVIDDRTMSMYARKKLVAVHRSNLPIRDAVVTYDSVPALQLIWDITGKRLTPETLVVLHSARLTKGVKCWKVDIQRTVYSFSPSAA